MHSFIVQRRFAQFPKSDASCNGNVEGFFFTAHRNFEEFIAVRENFWRYAMNFLAKNKGSIVCIFAWFGKVKRTFALL